MAVENLQPGEVKEVQAGEITGNCHIYRTGQGSDSSGSVGWKPDHGDLVSHDIAVGGTVTFGINGQKGMIANGCPSMVQLLWSNTDAKKAKNTKKNLADKILGEEIE